MSEHSLWQLLREHMPWDEATRHEDACQSGTADVSFVAGGRHGWLELKHSHVWPVRPGTIVRLEHFTDEQRRFLKVKGRSGGNTWVLWQVRRTYMLFDWRTLPLVGTTAQAPLREAATAIWEPRLDFSELLRCFAVY